MSDPPTTARVTGLPVVDAVLLAALPLGVSYLRVCDQSIP